MQDQWSWLFFGALFSAEAYLFYVKSKDPRERARRAFTRTKNTRIGEIKDGEWVKVTGTVGAVGPAMTSPISGRECIGFWSEVDSVDQNRVVTKREGRCGAFSISDDTGQVIVAGPFLFTIEIEEEWSPVPPEHAEFLAQIGMRTEGLLRDGKVREALLRPDDRVSVLGLAFLEPDPAAPSAGFRLPPLVRRLRGSGPRPVILGPVGKNPPR